MKPTIYLLKPGFEIEGQGPYFCPDCAFVEGVLSYYPEVTDAFDVRRIAFTRPRSDLVERLGADGQSCPVIVFNAADAPAEAVDAGLGYSAIEGSDAIVRYLAAQGLTGSKAP